MKLYIRILTKENGYTFIREIEVPEEELRGLIESDHLREGITLESFQVVGIKD